MQEMSAGDSTESLETKSVNGKSRLSNRKLMDMRVCRGLLAQRTQGQDNKQLSVSNQTLTNVSFSYLYLITLGQNWDFLTNLKIVVEIFFKSNLRAYAIN